MGQSKTTGESTGILGSNTAGEMVQLVNAIIIGSDQIECEVPIAELSDTDLEIAACSPATAITWTFSINLFYCRFC